VVAADDSPEPAPAASEPPSEAEQLLGRGVKSPVGIPRSYKPTEVSAHELLRIELVDFAGPLDLLLYLIRAHDIDVFDIPIAFITERYLAMLEAVSDLPIDIAAEFLVMAAELAHIKSKMLLPPKEGVPVEAESDEEGDPRADLVRRLLEYQKYRAAADHLEASEQLGRDVFTRTPTGDKAEVFDPGFRDTSIFRLVEAMADVLSRLTPEKQHEVIADTVTVAECIERILAYGDAHGPRFGFRALLLTLASRREVVVSFLAVLEMARTRMLRIVQEPENVAGAEAEPAQAPQATQAPDEPELAARPPLTPMAPPTPAEIELELTGLRPAVPTDGFDARPAAAFEDAEEPDPSGSSGGEHA
jgi:segregation and condensation protein A